jgi:hypothetical protein
VPEDLHNHAVAEGMGCGHGFRSPAGPLGCNHLEEGHRSLAVGAETGKENAMGEEHRNPEEMLAFVDSQM